MSQDLKNIISYYQFFVHSGFDFTLDEIAEGVGLTKKTIHNRYVSRHNLEKQVLNYYKNQFISKFDGKIEFSNHSIESLLLLIFELELSIIHEFPLFYKANCSFHEITHFDSHYLIPAIFQIIQSGQLAGDINGETDPKKYAVFFLYNLITVYFWDTIFQLNKRQTATEKEKKSILNRTIQLEFVEYIILPILTEQGKQRFKQIDLNFLFMGS
jgi:hypothetical protein